MAKSLNQVTLVGRLGKDAETRFTPGGVSVTSFSVATERSWKDQKSGEWVSETDWHNVVLWKKEKLAGYLSKGTTVCVTGRLQTRNYEDKGGGKRYVTEVIAEDVVLCGGSSGQGSSGGRSNAGGLDDDECPF